jgi:hypothetical protein
VRIYREWLDNVARRAETRPREINVTKKLDDQIADLLREVFPELRQERLPPLVKIMRLALRLCAQKAGVRGLLDR